MDSINGRNMDIHSGAVQSYTNFMHNTLPYLIGAYIPVFKIQQSFNFNGCLPENIALQFIVCQFNRND